MAGIRDTVGKKKSRVPHVSRRSLLVGATAAGGLAIAWSLWPRDYQPNLTAAPTSMATPNQTAVKTASPTTRIA